MSGRLGLEILTAELVAGLKENFNVSFGGLDGPGEKINWNHLEKKAAFQAQPYM